jgi:uridine phosphorylase
MGGPSTSILLHEVAKLLKYAGAKATWLRMGTCGGIGVDEGTIVVTNQAYNTDMKPYFE